MTTLRLEDGAWAASEKAPEVEITLESWRDGVRPEAGSFALVLPNDADVSEVGAATSAFGVIILQFPDFKDGRAFSQARLLRDRYGFAGEIRARGDVLCDQALFMARSGFDALEIGGGTVDGFIDALKAFSAFYQAGADGSESAWRRRTARAVAA